MNQHAFGLRPSSRFAARLVAFLLAFLFLPVGNLPAQDDDKELPLRVRVRVRILEWQLSHQLDTGFAFRYLRDVNSANNIAAADATFPKSTQRDGINAFFDRITFGSAGGAELAIQALEATNRLRVLSEPTLTVNAAHPTPARFNSGRDIPFEALRASHGVLLSVTQFRSTGISLTIKDVDVFALEHDPNQRFIKMDFKVNVTRPGQEVPVNIGPQRQIITQFRTISRELETSLFIPEHSPFIAGIIKNSTETENTSGIPFLSEIPIVGALFRNNDLKKMDTELVFMVTAEVLWPDNPILPEFEEREERDVETDELTAETDLPGLEILARTAKGETP